MRKVLWIIELILASFLIVIGYMKTDAILMLLGCFVYITFQLDRIKDKL